MNRGPIGVWTRTTPVASFSIHITGPTWNLKLARAILGPPLLHLGAMHGKPFFQGFTDILIETCSACLPAQNFFGNLSCAGSAEMGGTSTGSLPYALTSGRMSIRRIWAATPKADPCSSTRTMVAWQQTQHFSPDVSSGGRISTSSTSVPFSILELV